MSREVESARRLLAKFGELVTMTKPGTPDYDPVTGATVAGTGGVSYVANGYPSRYMQSDIDGLSVQQNDTRLILELIAERPEQGWTALIDGITYRVMDVQPIRKAGADVIYICQVRAS